MNEEGAHQRAQPVSTASRERRGNPLIIFPNDVLCDLHNAIATRQFARAKGARVIFHTTGTLVPRRGEICERL
jgi:pyruvate-formate lyase-activating enzyme